MTHISEDAFADHLEAKFEDADWVKNHDREVWLERIDRYADFHIVTYRGLPDLAVEVENDFESVHAGHSQAHVYAQYLDAKPVVIVPAGHIEWPECILLDTDHVDIWQVEVPSDD